MEAVPDPVLTPILLTLGRTVALGFDAALQVTGVHNAALLEEWREAAAGGSQRPAALQPLLEELMAPSRARDLAQQLADSLASLGQAGLYLGVVALHAPRGGAPERHAALSLHPAGATQEAGFLLVLRDVTALTDLQQNLAETQGTLDAAMAALRAPPHDLRMFLSSALTSISAIRATLKIPAREPAALQEKLARLHAAVAQLRSEAETLALTPIQDACQALLNRVAALLEREELTGDALLPLATLVDRIAGTAGTLWRIEEQRHSEPKPGRAAQRRQPDWNFATERRWSSFLRHRGEEIGVLVNLEMEGAVHVPKPLRARVDELLEHMLRNVVEYGIETPEQRLATGKPATGKVLVRFEDREGGQLRMTVRDDGRERGLGLSFLRKAVAGLGGSIDVKTAPDRRTEFVIDLPYAAAPAAYAAQRPGA